MSAATSTETVAAAEATWLRRWTAGPAEDEGRALAAGTPAPDLVLPDQDGVERSLSEFWAAGPALIMFWRHFGCSCGVQRARRLRTEWDDYREAGLSPVVIGLGTPARARAYRWEHDLPCPILCDPAARAYRAYGVGQWTPARILYDAPEETWTHTHEVGVAFQEMRRARGRPLVDDPWRAPAEFVVDPDGVVALPYAYQYCEDYPDPRVLVAAARMIGIAGAARSA